MKLLKILLVGLILVGLVAPAPAALPAAPETKPETVPRISPDTLKSWLNNPEVMVIDVRAAKDWEESGFKILGSVRREKDQVQTWGPTLPRDKRLVLYCA